MQEIIREYDPHFRAMSLDEAYMDITKYVDAYVASKENGLGLAETLAAMEKNEATTEQPRVYSAEQIAYRQQCAEEIVNEVRGRIFERTRKCVISDDLLMLNGTHRGICQKFRTDSVGRHCEQPDARENCSRYQQAEWSALRRSNT